MTKTIYIEGMSCGHCVAHVENALKELYGVETVKVDLAGKKALVEFSESVRNEKIIAAIDEAGYEVTNIE